MNAVYCLDCDRRLHINSKYEVGDAIKCPNCESEFELVSLQPPAIEWLYDSYDDDDDDEMEEEQEDEEIEVLSRRDSGQEQRRSNEPRLIFRTDWDE